MLLSLLSPPATPLAICRIAKLTERPRADPAELLAALAARVNAPAPLLLALAARVNAPAPFTLPALAARVKSSGPAMLLALAARVNDSPPPILLTALGARANGSE